MLATTKKNRMRRDYDCGIQGYSIHVGLEPVYTIHCWRVIIMVIINKGGFVAAG